MRFRFLVSLGVTVLSASAIQAEAAPRRSKPGHVFIISFDGGKPSVMQRSSMPTLKSMLRQGSGTWKARAVLPSVTLVNHTSMLTGVVPSRHRVTWNDWMPWKGVVTVPTVFQLAKRQGLKTALFAGKKKFRHLNVPGTLDRFDIPGYKSDVVAAAAASYIKAQKPNLCFIHFAESDGAGHTYGWGSSQQVQAFEDEDRALKVVRDAVRAAGIEKDSVFILSADHGGHGRTHGTDSPEDVLIPWIAWGRDVQRGKTLKTTVSTTDTAATALTVLGIPVPVSWNGVPVWEAFFAAPPKVRRHSLAKTSDQGTRLREKIALMDR